MNLVQRHLKVCHHQRTSSNHQTFSRDEPPNLVKNLTLHDHAAETVAQNRGLGKGCDLVERLGINLAILPVRL